MSGSPTTKNPGSPRARSTWTSTGRALAPRSAAHRKEACTPGPIASGVPESCQREMAPPAPYQIEAGCQKGRPQPSASARQEQGPDQGDRGEEHDPPASGL